MADRLVCDLSYNDIGLTDPACLKAHGVSGVILGVFSRGNPPHDMADLGDLCMRAGLPVISTYGLPYFGYQPAVERDPKWAIELARHFGVNKVMLDCEADAHEAGWDSAPVPTPAQRVEELTGVRRMVEGAGLMPFIYTAEWFWGNQMGNSTAFSDLGLLHATYGKDGYPIAPIRTVNYGGWTTLWGHQFTSMWGAADPNEPARCGRAERDMSYWYHEEDDVVSQQEWEAMKLRLFAGSERRDLTRDQRLAIADAELAAADTKQSVSDVAASAIYVALQKSGAITSGMSEEDVRGIIEKELAGARIVAGGSNQGGK